MPSDTLTEGLQKYAIGEKLRRLRLPDRPIRIPLISLSDAAGRVTTWPQAECDSASFRWNAYWCASKWSQLSKSSSFLAAAQHFPGQAALVFVMCEEHLAANDRVFDSLRPLD